MKKRGYTKHWDNPRPNQKARLLQMIAHTIKRETSTKKRQYVFGTVQS